MTPEQYAKIKRVFLEALDRSEGERAAFVATACSEDPAIIAEVEALLVAHEPEGPGAESQTESARPVATSDHCEPGSLVLDRYRILHQIGRGGMGAVYRARDELLGTFVALKFPLTSGARATRRLLDEVRLSREITHPAVCRVFDVGQVDGQPFFTMEYVDGEDLASQLRRFGRLSPHKAFDIARQVATGIAAAHAKGVLHRDLKPANILVDSDGRVRITDFGIAVAVDQASGATRAGTPGYIAPEQLVPGREVNERADVYAWGVLVWELLTGWPRFEQKAGDALIEAQLQLPSKAPSMIVADVPAGLDRAVRKAMALDPAERPASALELLILLGGDDVLDVARSIGVTPSPEFVARSAAPGRCSWPRVITWCAATLVALGLFAWIVDLRAGSMDPELARAPAVLRERAIEVLDALGYPEPGVDLVEQETDNGYLPDPTVRERDGQVLYWYTRDLDPGRSGFVGDVLDRSGQLGGMDPAAARLSQLLILLNPDGRLVSFQTDVPPDVTPAGGDGLERVSAEHIGALCGLGPFTAQGPMPRSPPVFAERTVRWTVDEVASVVDAAFVGPRPVYIAVDRNPDHTELLARRLERPERFNVLTLAVVLVLLISIPLAWRNIGRGRADRVGAFRVAMFAFGCSAGSLLFRVGHVRHPLIPDSYSVIVGVLGAVVGTLAIWVSYAGLEPAVRRHWPRTLLEWTEVLHGNTRDPRLGLALLAGPCFGVIWAIFIQADAELWSERVGDAALAQEGFLLDAVLEPWQVLATMLDNLRIGLYQTLFTVLLLVLVRYVLRKSWAAVLGFVLLTSVIYGALGSHVGSLLTLGLPLAVTSCVLLLRFGIVTHALATMFMNLLLIFAFNLDFDAWYTLGLEATLLLLVVLMGSGAWLATRDATVRA